MNKCGSDYVVCKNWSKIEPFIKSWSISRSGYKDGSWSKTKGGLKNISINRSKSGRKVCG